MKKSVDRWVWITYLIMPLVLSWPAWMNGQAFFFTDSTAYIKGAASAVQLVFPSAQTRAWLNPPGTPVSAAALDGTPAPRAQVETQLQTQLRAQAEKYTSSPNQNGVLAGRSVYYGFCVFVLAALFGFMAIPIVQALVAVAIVSTLLRSRFDICHRTVCAVLLTLAVISPLPFFNSMVMPDVFAGLGACAVLGLILIPRASTGNRALWMAVTAAAVLFHTGNIMILLGLVGCVVLLKLLMQRRLAMRSSGVLLALVLISIGVFGEALFGMAVKHVTHAAPIRPPFMTARLLADGPGNSFVAQYCPQAGFEVCRYRRDFTRGGSDDFLWNLDPHVGVFTLASRESRDRLSHEDVAFAKAVVTKYPIPVLKSALANVGDQLSYIGLSEFNYAPEMVTGFAFKLPADVLRQLRGTLAARNAFDTHYSEILIKAGAILGLLLCLAALPAIGKRRDFNGVALILSVFAATLINAVVCGVLSTPHDRYQARIIWLIELAGLVIVLSYFGFIRAKASPAVASDPAGASERTPGDAGAQRTQEGGAPLAASPVPFTNRRS